MKVSRISLAVVASALLSSPAIAAPAKDCEVMAFLIQQARIDLALIRGKQIAKARCSSRDSEFACFWAFPGDGYGFAEEEADHLKKCVAAYPSARKIAGKRGAAVFEFDPDLSVTVPAPEIDGNGNWAVGFRIRLTPNP